MIGDAEIELLHLAREVQDVFDVFKYIGARVSVEGGAINVELANGMRASVEEPAVIDQTTAVEVARELRKKLTG